MSKDEKWLKRTKLLTLLTFSLGTSIFGSYLLSNSILSLIAGVYFAALAVLVNCIFVGLLLFKNQDRLWRNILLLSVNIPVCLIYIYTWSYLLDTVFLNVINDTNFAIKDIKVSGCEDLEVHDELLPGEEERFYISISGDCVLYISYEQDGKQISHEGIYFSGGMGRTIDLKCSEEKILW